MVNCVKNILSHEGVLGFYKGLQANIVKVMQVTYPVLLQVNEVETIKTSIETTQTFINPSPTGAPP